MDVSAVSWELCAFPRPERKQHDLPYLGLESLPENWIFPGQLPTLSLEFRGEPCLPSDAIGPRGLNRIAPSLGQVTEQFLDALEY